MQLTEETIEVLPIDASLEEEALKVGSKRIAPDRVLHHQLTPEEGIKKIREDLNFLNVELEGHKQIYTVPRGLKKLIEAEKTEAQKEYLVKYLERNKDYLSRADIQDRVRRYIKRDAHKRIWLMKEALNAICTDEYATVLYIQKVKEDISHGYRFPKAVLEYDRSFMVAVTSRERYEKGVNTSFSADDSRIVFDDRIEGGMKRQDGKALTEQQKEEIVNGVLQFQRVIGIDLNAISKKERWVYSHLNGKNPFLRKNAAGMYRKDISEQSVCISIGGVESFDVDVKTEGKKKEKVIVNTTMAHELGHALDYYVKSIYGTGLYTGNVSRLVYKMNNWEGLRTSKYWTRHQEIVARCIEQYVYVMEGGSEYFDRSGYWSKEIFETEIKPSIESSIKHFLGEYLIG